MKLSNTIGFFSEKGYSPEYGVDICAKAGFDAVDFAFHSNSKFSDADSVNEKGNRQKENISAMNRFVLSFFLMLLLYFISSNSRSTQSAQTLRYSSVTS